MAPANCRDVGPWCPGARWATKIHCSLPEAKPTISTWGHSVNRPLGDRTPSSTAKANVPQTNRPATRRPASHPRREQNCYLERSGNSRRCLQRTDASHELACPAHMASTNSGSNTELKGLVFTGFALTTLEARGGLRDKVCANRRQGQVCHLLADQAEQVLQPVQGCRLSSVNRVQCQSPAKPHRGDSILPCAISLTPTLCPC